MSLTAAGTGFELALMRAAPGGQRPVPGDRPAGLHVLHARPAAARLTQDLPGPPRPRGPRYTPARR